MYVSCAFRTVTRILQRLLLERVCLFATGLKKGDSQTREGVKSVVGLLERRKHSGGIKGLDDKSIGMEILMTETFSKIKPTDPLIIKLFIMNR